jgi:cell surface protein SprA
LKNTYQIINHNILKISIVLMLVFFGFKTFAQVEQPQDSVKGFDKGKITIGNPPSIVAAYTYDPITNQYIYTNTLGGFNTTYPVILSPEEYNKLVLKEKMHDYFKKKGDAIEGKKPGSEEEKRNLLPKFYVNSGFFESIFGSNTIDVKPTGSVEVDFGMRHTKQDNPAFSPENRSTTTFDFNQRISVGLKGTVGTRLKVNFNYDTQSTFAFQNLIKLEFDPSLGGGEDNILQKIEVGNVSMPLSSSLIRGAQSLFGVKTELKFGRTTVTGVFSEQKSQTKTVTSEGGGTVQKFDLFALDYDADRHFFLSQYFRNSYDKALKNYPVIDSRVQITRMEVWVTNKQIRINSTENNSRNIIALQDLGEAQQTGYADNLIVGNNSLQIPTFFRQPVNAPVDNKNNLYDPAYLSATPPTTGTGLLNQNIRDIGTINIGFTGFPASTGPSEGRDYAKLENAKKLMANEYTFHPQLGYISLRQKLANDEVLAVAYQYTIGEEVFQVGEFANDGLTATTVDPLGVPTTKSLIVKLLKSSLTSITDPATQTTTPLWNLMMKNIYQIPGAYQLQPTDFKFNIVYSDPSPLNYISQAPPAPNGAPSISLPANVEQTPLLKVFNIDNLNSSNDPQVGGDGFFDFIPGLTVDPQNGKIIFTTVEPFGKYLFEKLRTNPSENYEDTTPTTITYNANQYKYVFRSMYKKTQTQAQQDSEKNKYELKGKFKSTSGDGIPLGAINVPKGSVVVTAGGRVLTEGADYTVNYQQGRVQILDPSLQASNTPIQVSVENNSVFGQQTRRFYGINVEHKFSEKFTLGGTFLKMSERPYTQKSVYGQESVNNTIFGMNTNFSTEVPFLTRLVNKLPNMDTDVPSNVSVKGEVAFLRPDTPQADQFGGVATSYVDDFEGSQSNIDMRSPQSWALSSVPKREGSPGYPEFGANSTAIDYGFNRAKLSWYSIDPTFYATRPSGVSDNDLSLNKTRRIFSDQLYPNTDVAQGQSLVVNTLDLSYFPTERGPYNNNPSFGTTPNNNFGGIMRSISSTNFEQSNVEFIQFWVMDPYFNEGAGNPQENLPTNTGKIYFNLGEISEDILQDGKKQYENGLPAAGSTLPTHTSIWGKVPSSQSLVYAFDVDPANRAVQDVGLDGLSDGEEGSIYTNHASEPDPAGDNYQYYLAANGNVIDRYKNYNNTQGNSPVDVTNTDRGSVTTPDLEDLNRDNTMNTVNGYYEYSIDMKPNITRADRYVTDIVETSGVDIPNGKKINTRWIQYKIPISTPENTIGGISDFRSIRFMRMFMTGFSNDITMRFGSLDLIRGEWRRYAKTLNSNYPTPIVNTPALDILTVDVQENSNRSPIRYVSPPGVTREEVNNNNTIVRLNEKALALRASGDGLEAGDSRGVFKNVSVDMRQYKSLKMFLHAESLPTPQLPTLQDKEMIGFIRFGNDFTENFYQVEIPLKVTAVNAATAEEVWPLENEIDLQLSLLTQLKILSMGTTITPDADGIRFANEEALDSGAAGKSNKLRLGIKGNPNFGLVRTLMVGVKNNTQNVPVTGAVGSKIKGEVWFNELRLAEIDRSGGMAAIMSLDANMADFATFSGTGKYSSIGFGSLEQTTNERSREELKLYDMVTNLSLGKLLPKKWGINLPFNFGVGETVITPKYDPFNQDIELQQLIDVTADESEKRNILRRAIDYTKRRSINFIGVRKQKVGEGKAHIYDPENFTISNSYNEMIHHDFEILDLKEQQMKTSVDYTFAFQPKPIEPFKDIKFMKKSSYYKILSDFNFNYLPSSLNFSSNIMRQYNRQQFRQVDVEGIGLDPLYRRNYTFNYQYGFNYNLTKALKLNFTGSTANIVRNYINEFNIPNQENTIWTDYWNIGEANQHNQQLVVNYDLPLSKIPFLSFIKSSYTYTGTSSWQRASNALSSFTDSNNITYNLGNTIQNSGAHKLNATFGMDAFYKYLGINKKGGQASVPKKPTTAPKPGEKIVNTAGAAPNEGSIFMNGLIGVLTSIKTIQADYTQNSGTVLPGYLPGIGFLGSARPSLGFVFGSQDDVRYEAAKNGWLTNYPNFNQNFTQVTTKTLNLTANMDLFPDFKIDWNANRTYAENSSEQYDIDGVDGPGYHQRSPYYSGNFAISTIMLKTAFRESNELVSSPFDDFRGNRIIIANRLAVERGIDVTIPANLDADGFPKGLGKNSQAVLIPSFLAAYTGVYGVKSGVDAANTTTSTFKDIPIPNWNVKYTGLMRYQFFKDTFKRFSLAHAYKSSYTINQFRSNLDFYKSTTGFDSGGNFLNQTIIQNINLVEQFNPLIRLDFETKSAFKILAEMKKDRALSLSFDNNLLTEVKGIEYVFGFGYRIKDVTFNSRMADNAQGIIKSDINIKTDFSYRNNQTIVRHLDYNDNQLAGGQNIWSVKLTADYAFSKYLTAIFFYDHSFTKAVISTSFPMTNIRSGFTLRYSFGN